MKRGTPMSVERRSLDGCEIVEIGGELDLTNAELLDEAISGTELETVVLDLGGLGFIDSAGVRTVDQAHRRLANGGRHLLVVAPSESRAAWTFRVAGFRDGFVLESLDAALERARLDGSAA